MSFQMRPSQTLCPSFERELSQNYLNTTQFQSGEDAYLRAEAIAHVHKLSLNDIILLSPKFWNMHTDPIICLDGAATTLLTIQYNLAVGTLGAFVSERNDLAEIVNNLMEFRAIGQFCLTELDHGLDAFHLETTATRLKDGSFELHTPHPGAAKFMPPTLPVLGKPCFAIVFAQLVASGTSYGIRQFLVCLNDGRRMSPGISARILPHRGNSDPVNHCLTTFTRVILPPSALLGDLHTSIPPRLQFFASIWRVAVGTLALTSIAVPGLAIAAHIALKYSLRRVVHSDGAQVPIFNFRTQQIPILNTIARAYVIRAFHLKAVEYFVDDAVNPFVQHGIATCFKAVVSRDFLDSQGTLAERCGAQGLFGHNRLIALHDEMRAIAIAEGDVLVLSIRLATELLLEKYAMPIASYPNSLLAIREKALIAKYRSVVTAGGHRSAKFASHVIPHCERIVRAIGYRIAYEAAIAANVAQGLIDLFVYTVVKSDLAWYIEDQLLTSDELEDLQDAAIRSCLPHAEKWVAELEVERYVSAPIVSEAAWNKFRGRLSSIGQEPIAKL
ncbi:acyl-CoA dehydrogenase NM domain-like protein [Favolaschia claudopus]|uniref:Acyl-CoA dehydrogenase NM domain-like protein n=1 Tax=Favolaschia claudopus TaxID=2862362 RepID=A0AAV9ZS49_9AGAR